MKILHGWSYERKWFGAVYENLCLRDEMLYDSVTINTELHAAQNLDRGLMEATVLNSMAEIGKVPMFEALG